MSNNDDTDIKVPKSFWKFLNEHSIRIPIIQHDYAQGREDKKEKRRRFLKDLKDTLASDTKELPLYFVYGSYHPEDKEDVFEPLDGQQRLTTLWLLHWYIAYMTGKLEDSSVQTTLKKFSYATRVSAREFCEKLCELPPLEGSNLLDHIKNQTWFYSSWEQDPTIKAMLRMLQAPSGCDNTKNDNNDDNIVGVFKQSCFEKYWEKLTNSEKSYIYFRVLNISKIGQTDDLYVKMNARGKPLTSFENFKAELVDYIQKQEADFNNSEHASWEELNNAKNGFSQKLDNAWTDIFWELRSEDASGNPEYQNHIDEIFFAFFNRFFFNYLANNLDNNSKSKNYWRNHPLYGENDSILAYNSLNQYKDATDSIPLLLFQELEMVLDRLKIFLETLTSSKSLDYGIKNAINKFNAIISPLWEKEPKSFFLPKYEFDVKTGNLVLQTDNNDNEILQITKIDINKRAVFFAICRWLTENTPKSINPDNQEEIRYSSEQITLFQDWIRFAWNIVENSNVEGNLPAGLRFFNKLSLHSADILSHLASLSNDDVNTICYNETTFESASEQLLEECQKARRIMGWRGNHGCKDEAWYYRIREAEKCAFFHGCIRFLYRSNLDIPDWNLFETKLSRANELFDIKGIKGNDETQFALIRLFLKSCTTWGQLCEHSCIFNTDSINWKNILTNKLWIKPIDIILQNTHSTDEMDLFSKLLCSYWDDVPFEKTINYRLKLDNGNLCFFPKYARSGVVFDQPGIWERNATLLSLKGKNIVSISNEIWNNHFIFGWHIEFTYCNHKFIWMFNGNIIDTKNSVISQNIRTEKQFTAFLQDISLQTNTVVNENKP